MSGRVCKLLRRMAAADKVNVAGLHAEWREMTARQRGAFRARHGVRFMRQRQLRRRVDGRDMRQMECDNPHPAGH